MKAVLTHPGVLSLTFNSKDIHVLPSVLLFYDVCASVFAVFLDMSRSDNFLSDPEMSDWLSQQTAAGPSHGHQVPSYRSPHFVAEHSDKTKSGFGAV